MLHDSNNISAKQVGHGIVNHDDVIEWKHFPRYWPFVRGIHRSPVNSPHTGQWCGALMFSLICVWINGWVNNHEAGDLRRYRAHCDVTVMHNGVLPVSITSECFSKIYMCIIVITRVFLLKPAYNQILFPRRYVITSLLIVLWNMTPYVSLIRWDHDEIVTILQMKLSCIFLNKNIIEIISQWSN